MSSKPQISPAIGYEPGMFETHPYLTSCAQTAAVVSHPLVLLVGRNRCWGTLLLKSLNKFESELFFAVPGIVTPEYAMNGAYNLILLDSSVATEQRRQLVSELAGSEVSIYYSFPVENDCWWLPTVRRGEYCHGAPAFRRSEFPFELERVLQDRTDG